MLKKERDRETFKGETEMPTCVNVSFMLLQSVLALESFAAALCFTDEPGVSFAGFLMLFKAVNKGCRRRGRKSSI